jgi:hypothetical protein
MQRRIGTVLLWLSLFSFVFGTLASVVGQSMTIADEVCSQSGLSDLKCAAWVYAEDHHGKLPPLGSVSEARAALSSPMRVDSWEIIRAPGRFYQPNPTLSGKVLDKILNADQIVLFYEPGERYGSRAVVFVDGHTKRIPHASWPALKKKSGITAPDGPPLPEPSATALGNFLMKLSPELFLVGGMLFLAGMLTPKRKRA